MTLSCCTNLCKVFMRDIISEIKQFPIQCVGRPKKPVRSARLWSFLKFRTSVYASNFRPIAPKLRQNAFRTICKKLFVRKNFGEKCFSKKFRTKMFVFLQFLVDFGGSRRILTLKLTSLSNFASDRPFWLKRDASYFQQGDQLVRLKLIHRGFA